MEGWEEETTDQTKEGKFTEWIQPARSAALHWMSLILVTTLNGIDPSTWWLQVCGSVTDMIRLCSIKLGSDQQEPFLLNDEARPALV